MSVFKDKAIVLKIDKIKDKELLYSLFTYEYWKIKANKKYSAREKSIDLWNIINFEIHTKENLSIHKIKNIKIKSVFDIKKEKKFSCINLYLELLALVYREISPWIQNKEIFEIVEHINTYENIEDIKIILAKIKIKYLLWNIWLEHNNTTIKKILKFISINHINEILKLSWINEELKKELEKI